MLRGAFYLFAEVSALFGRAKESGVENSWDLAEFLLEKAFVAVVPGAAFEGEGCIRLTFAAARDRIEEGVRRMREALSLLP